MICRHANWQPGDSYGCLLLGDSVLARWLLLDAWCCSVSMRYPPFFFFRDIDDTVLPRSLIVSIWEMTDDDDVMDLDGVDRIHDCC